MTAAFSPSSPNPAAMIFRRRCPQFGFPGLRPGDRWCLCAPRWREALERRAVHPAWSCELLTRAALEHCSLADLKRFALDLA